MGGNPHGPNRTVLGAGVPVSRLADFLSTFVMDRHVMDKTGLTTVVTYEPNATDTATTEPLVAYVSFFQSNVKVMETPMVKVTEGIDPKSHMLPIKLSFPLAKLKPGEYDCEVSILDPATQKSAFWQAPVMVIP